MAETINSNEIEKDYLIMKIQLLPAQTYIFSTYRALKQICEKIKWLD
jgi:hypothetical protein